MGNKKSKKGAERAQRTHAAKYFAKVAALNELIDKGGVAAKDAVLAKVSLADHCQRKSDVIRKSTGKNKGKDALDSCKRLPGSFESGKRR